MTALRVNISDAMKSFRIVQNVLTALLIPFLAIIVGIAATPGVYVFYKILELTSTDLMLNLDSIVIEEFVFMGIAIGVAMMTWGISLVIICGTIGGLFRPRLEPGRYPLQSFVTIQWAWSMVFHRIALFFLHS